MSQFICKCTERKYFTFRKIGFFFFRPSLSCSKWNYGRSCWVEKNVANAILIQALLTWNVLLRVEEMCSWGSWRLLQGVQSLCFCFPCLNCLHSHELPCMMSPYLLFFFILTVGQPDPKHRSPAKNISPSHYKLEVTQLLLLWCQENNIRTQHKYMEEWNMSWHGTCPNPDYPA